MNSAKFFLANDFDLYFLTKYWFKIHTYYFSLCTGLRKSTYLCHKH